MRRIVGVSDSLRKRCVVITYPIWEMRAMAEIDQIDQIWTVVQLAPRLVTTDNDLQLIVGLSQA